MLNSDLDARAKISHSLRRSQESNQEPVFNSHTIQEIVKRPLPRPSEQADILVRRLAEESKGPGENVDVNEMTHGGIVGVKSASGFSMILEHLVGSKLIIQTSKLMGGTYKVALSFAGWEQYERLRTSRRLYHRAFMAMQFGDADLNRVLEEAFKPAAEQAAFKLFKLDEIPRAGLIDDRLRVEIQSSDFLIADLTHDNLGAYWEAGYAEGLGKPVIYTYEKLRFAQRKTHFDTNHHLTVLWDLEHLQEAAEMLKATIRATLPHIARQQDDGGLD